MVPYGKTDTHACEQHLHGSNEDVDDPGAPAAKAEADDHVDTEDPGILRDIG